MAFKYQTFNFEMGIIKQNNITAVGVQMQPNIVYDLSCHYDEIFESMWFASSCLITIEIDGYDYINNRKALILSYFLETFQSVLNQEMSQRLF